VSVATRRHLVPWSSSSHPALGSLSDPGWPKAGAVVDSMTTTVRRPGCCDAFGRTYDHCGSISYAQHVRVDCYDSDMLFVTPPLGATDLEAIDAIERLRDDLRFYLARPRRWYGTLRRAVLARAVQGSNSIEGYHASVEDVAALIEGEPALDANEETSQAIAGYRDAMTYVLQLAGSPTLIDQSLIRSLHFMMLKYDLSKRPGQWRPGAIWVEDQDGHAVYEAPDVEQIAPLMAELVDQLDTVEGNPMIRAAMAHLNLTMIHPFSDGNGRMARCLQSLVLAADGIISPEFASIEEYLGRNTASYCAVLAQVGQGHWQPERSARPWIEYCLTAHYHQALTVLRRMTEAEALWDACAQLASKSRLPERSVGALCDAARGQRLYRSLYRKLTLGSSGEVITDTTATRDLRAMADAGLLVASGEKRGRQYRGSDHLRAEWNVIRSERRPLPQDGPYPAHAQPPLPGM
jgi:Fic family protein